MQVSNLLMFTGEAEEAMTFYVTLFPQSRIVSVERYGADEAGVEGSIKHAVFELCADRPSRCSWTSIHESSGKPPTPR
jgi:predicted 3-demethylubiquinone-9 3-methyltransferase (glyoxalase superfamily)